MWIKKAQEEHYPVFFFRFEDITRDPKPVLMDVFAFSLGFKSVAGTVVESKIDYLMRKKAVGKIQTQLYKPRDASVNNKNLNRFSSAQIQWITAELGSLLDFFEYNFGNTNFFPAIDVSESAKFRSVNSEARRAHSQPHEM